MIRRAYMEAAARLALWTDFDIRLFDAFCVCLLGEDELTERSGPGLVHSKSLQKRFLFEWLLALSAQLIDPHTKVCLFVFSIS